MIISLIHISRMFNENTIIPRGALRRLNHTHPGPGFYVSSSGSFIAFRGFTIPAAQFPMHVPLVLFSLSLRIPYCTAVTGQWEESPRCRRGRKNHPQTSPRLQKSFSPKISKKFEKRGLEAFRMAWRRLLWLWLQHRNCPKFISKMYFWKIWNFEFQNV